MAVGYVLVNVTPGMEIEAYNTIKAMDNVDDITVLSNSFNSGILNLHRLMKYSISTINLYFIKAFSEKNSLSSDVLEAYLPSIGEIAFKLLLFIELHIIRIC